MKDKIKAILIRPGEGPQVVEIKNDLKTLQSIVGGYIETVTIGKGGCAVLCNEDGRLLGLPYNCTVGGVDFVGDIVIVGVKGEEFADAPAVIVRRRGGWFSKCHRMS